MSTPGHDHDPDRHAIVPTPSPTVETFTALAAVEQERRRQLALWPAEHDDHHDTAEWVALVLEQLARAILGGPVWRRSRFVKAAAILTAAIEAHDRDLARYERNNDPTP